MLDTAAVSEALDLVLKAVIQPSLPGYFIPFYRSTLKQRLVTSAYANNSHGKKIIIYPASSKITEGEKKKKKSPIYSFSCKVYTQALQLSVYT